MILPRPPLGSSSRAPSTPIFRWLRGGALACVVGAGLAGQAWGYDVVQRGGTVTHVTSLAFSGPTALLATEQGRTSLEASLIDFYETFRRNLGQAGGNLVVFKTGALLRFDSLDIKDGSVGVKVAGGSSFIVPESLIDFEASVREGAMIRLPESAVSSVAVSRSTPRGAAPIAYEEPPQQEEMQPPEAEVGENEAAAAPAPTGRPTRPGRPGFNRSRRFGADRGAANQESQEPQPLTPGEEGDPQGGGDSVPFGGPGQGGQGGSQGGQEQSETAGQTVLMVTTTYSGEIGGLQVTVTFPPNLKVVQPVAFSGFASSLAMPTVNAAVPGQVQLIAVNSDMSGAGVQAGGEFLRLTFAWVGRAPTAQQFSVAVKATDPTTGAELPEFPREINVF